MSGPPDQADDHIKDGVPGVVVEEDCRGRGLCGRLKWTQPDALEGATGVNLGVVRQVRSLAKGGGGILSAPGFGGRQLPDTDYCTVKTNGAEAPLGVVTVMV